MKKEEWRDPHNALSDWNESHQNPCAWKGISCDAFNTVTLVDLTGASIFGNLTSFICSLPNLTVLTLQDNDFSGPFPHGLLNCKRLRKLDLSSNHFAGTLPTRISKLSELSELNLAFNAFSGSFPSAFGMLPKLEALFLHGNSLNGAFPRFVGYLKSLVHFTLGNNPLRPGAVPRELGNLIQLQQLLLYNCNLVGGIPTFFRNLTQLEWLDLSHNHLSGDIPASLMALSNLRVLFLNVNNLYGQIPAIIDQMRSLSSLDLSCNRLSGDIPTELGHLKLDAFNVSNNHLAGHVPDALDNPIYQEGFLGNQRLCGEVDESYILCNLKEANVIASGGAAKVHKVILPNGESVAVNKIPNKSRTAESLEIKGDQQEKERWKTEVDILGLIRHNNIIKLLCCISSEQSDFKLLVYEFMPNGTLFDRLHGGAGPHEALQWTTRYQIALGVACGLSYMHHDCPSRIFHRDLNPRNILLDEDFGAKIAGFAVSVELDGLGNVFAIRQMRSNKYTTIF
ncbi:hypothetical protein SUGI_1086250 [Cryptomeria japonica]|nr:hypothetical protein SUGI_1086250 [Cryptomeria japonica]